MKAVLWASVLCDDSAGFPARVAPRLSHHRMTDTGTRPGAITFP